MYGFGMMFGWIIFFILIGIVVYALVQKNSDNKSEKNAQDILDERYAKGEIDEQEYKEKCKNLKEH